MTVAPQRSWAEDLAAATLDEKSPARLCRQ